MIACFGGHLPEYAYLGRSPFAVNAGFPKGELGDTICRQFDLFLLFGIQKPGEVKQAIQFASADRGEGGEGDESRPCEAFFEHIQKSE